MKIIGTVYHPLLKGIAGKSKYFGILIGGILISTLLLAFCLYLVFKILKLVGFKDKAFVCSIVSMTLALVAQLSY
jgi:hypothetical protein